MFGFIERKLEQRNVNNIKKELDSFLILLKKSKNDEVATYALYAAIAKNAIEARPQKFGLSGKHSILTPLLFSESDKNYYRFLRDWQITMHRKGDTMVVTGLSPWLFTFTAVEFPEMRLSVNEMWGELTRGFPYVKLLASITGVQEFEYAGYDKIPDEFI